jgi:AraC-like DNA-binding protein
MSENTNNARARCLWLDLKTSITVTDTPTAFAGRCQVIRTGGFDAAALERVDPDFVVLEFDYPSRQDMARAARFKEQFSGLPMVVVTVQHSEALAVWFFRARFYDFLVQPLPADDVANCISRLGQIAELRRAQPGRTSARSATAVPTEVPSQGNAAARLEPALAYIERNYHRRLLITEVADACGLAAFRFGRDFKEQFGMDFREYVLRYRIREACRLLRNPNASVTEVGYSVGFSEPSYFTKTFKSRTGRCPSQVVGIPYLQYTIERDQVSPNYQSSSAKS